MTVPLISYNRRIVMLAQSLAPGPFLERVVGASTFARQEWDHRNLGDQYRLFTRLGHGWYPIGRCQRS